MRRIRFRYVCPVTELLGVGGSGESSGRPLLSLQTAYRIMVEILNENDNSPVFAENTVQSLIISEVRLTSANIRPAPAHTSSDVLCLCVPADSGQYAGFYRPGDRRRQ